MNYSETGSRIVQRKKDVIPYLDVMTVQSRQFVPHGQAHPKHESDLLVEPVHVPDLKHTGVDFGLHPSKHPLFYPNGHKTTTIRDVIQKSLTQSVSTGNLNDWDYGSPSSPSSSGGYRRSKGKKKNFAERDSILGTPNRVSTSTKKRNNIAARSTDSKTKALLSEIRSNSNKITGLVI